MELVSILVAVVLLEVGIDSIAQGLLDLIDLL